ncbi:hypothetical protein Ctob_016096, partial [Chrysochromulina tobinii]
MRCRSSSPLREHRPCHRTRRRGLGHWTCCSPGRPSRWRPTPSHASRKRCYRLGRRATSSRTMRCRRSSPSREHPPRHRARCRGLGPQTHHPPGWPSRWRPTPSRASRKRLDGARRRHVHHESVGTALGGERRRAERSLAHEVARHQSTSRAIIVRDAVAFRDRLAARLDGPVDGARRRHVHHESVGTASADERCRAERCLAAEVARHESTARAVVRDAIGVACTAGLDGPVDGARRSHVHHISVATALAGERRRAERRLAAEEARHESTSRAIVRDAVALVTGRAACLDGPVDGARRRHVHHESVGTAAAREERRAERCVAAEEARHESTARAIVCDAVALVLGRAARLDGPVDGARRRHVHHESVFSAAARERRRAERCLAAEVARHESTAHAIVLDAEAKDRAGTPRLNGP